MTVHQHPTRLLGTTAHQHPTVLLGALSEGCPEGEGSRGVPPVTRVPPSPPARQPHLSCTPRGPSMAHSWRQKPSFRQTMERRAVTWSRARLALHRLLRMM